MNNFFVDSIVENRFNEYFGFTDGEVRELLAYYGFDDRYDERLRNEGRTEIKAFGIAFCRKRCRVACADG